MKPPKKSKKWQGLRNKLLNYEQQGDTIQRFNHKPFSLVTLYGESEVKPEKIPE